MTTFLVILGFATLLAAFAWLGSRARWEVPLTMSLLAVGIVIWIDPLNNGEGAVGDPKGYLLLAGLLGAPTLGWISYLIGWFFLKVRPPHPTSV